MRTNVDIDDLLLRKAFKATGLKTKKAVINEALRRVARYSDQIDTINALTGLAHWEGDLRAFRRDRDLRQ